LWLWRVLPGCGGDELDRRDAQGGNPQAYRNSVVGLYVALALVLGTLAAGSLWNSRAEAVATDFELTSTGLENGEFGPPVTFRLSDYRGKTVVLDFMAVNCASCRIVTDNVLKPLWQEHGGKGNLVILSIDTWSDSGSGNVFGGEDDEAIRRLQNETDVPWRHARDTDQVYLSYSAVSLPKLVVVDPEGRIVYERVGLQSLARVEAAVTAAAVGQATPVPVFRFGLAGMAVVAGLACVFTPCGIGLLPAYFALHLEQAAQSAAPARLSRALRGGAAAALGAVLLYGALAVLFWLIGPTLRPALPWLGPVLGLGIAALGVAALATGTWSPLVVKLGLRVDPRRGFMAFGAAYALAGFACTGPLFLPLLLAGFLQSTLTGFWVFALYTGAVAMVLILAAVLVAYGEEHALKRLLGNGKRIHQVSAVVLIIGGLAVAAYAAMVEGLL
jgi:cytochrome c biogenesis protein CcdA